MSSGYQVRSTPYLLSRMLLSAGVASNRSYKQGISRLWTAEVMTRNTCTYFDLVQLGHRQGNARPDPLNDLKLSGTRGKTIYRRLRYVHEMRVPAQTKAKHPRKARLTCLAFLAARSPAMPLVTTPCPPSSSTFRSNASVLGGLPREGIGDLDVGQQGQRRVSSSKLRRRRHG